MHLAMVDSQSQGSLTSVKYLAAGLSSTSKAPASAQSCLQSAAILASPSAYATFVDIKFRPIERPSVGEGSSNKEILYTTEWLVDDRLEARDKQRGELPA